MLSSLLVLGVVWSVEAGQSIQAIHDQVSCGDRIEVAAGRYQESLNLWQSCSAEHPIEISGVSRDRPRIDGGGQPAIRFSGSGYRVSHLDLTTDPACVKDHRVVFGNGRAFEFSDLVIHDGGYDGFGTYCGAEEIRLLDSEIARNGLGCVDGDGNILNGDGLDLYACRRCEVSKVWVHGNNNYALQIKGGAAHVRVHDALLHTHSQYGVLLGRPGTEPCPGTQADAEDVMIDHVVLLSTRVTAWPLRIADVRSLHVFQNTVVLRDNESVLPENPEGIAGGFVLFEEDLAASRTAWIQNNLFFSRGAPLLAPVAYDHGDRDTLGEQGAWSMDGRTFDHNLWWEASRGGAVEPADQAESSIVADPRFVDDPRDLSLSPESPAVDVGADLSLWFSDRWVGAGFDLGAYEVGTDGHQPDDPMDPPPGALGRAPRGCGCATERRETWTPLVLTCLWGVFCAFRRRPRASPRTLVGAEGGARWWRG